MAFHVFELKDSVCTNASADKASIGSKTGPPAMREEPLTKISMIATMQIPKTAQTKAAFHHGSTVPYGIAVIAIRPTSAPKTALLSLEFTDHFLQDLQDYQD